MIGGKMAIMTVTLIGPPNSYLAEQRFVVSYAMFMTGSCG